MSKWEIVGNNMLVNDDFKNDAALLLSGDWNNEEEMRNFLTDVCNKLNHYVELEAENARYKDILAYLGDCGDTVIKVLDEAKALSEDYCKEQREERYDLTFNDDIEEMPGGEYYAKADIAPILKAARVVAEGLQSLTKRSDCDCDICQAARLIIEKTEGLDNE